MEGGVAVLRQASFWASHDPWHLTTYVLGAATPFDLQAKVEIPGPFVPSQNQDHRQVLVPR